MIVPSAILKRLFLGFTCSIVFLVVFATLVAYNTEAQSSGHSVPAVDDYPFTISIPTSKPEATISFYEALGFKSTPGLSRGLDIVCLEKEGSPYKLEISHDKFTEMKPVVGGVSGMSFPVANLETSVQDLRRSGMQLRETRGERDGVVYASIKDPNGISVNLFQR
ncbi:MAG: VOC family protein [Pseudomonadota bacterium]